jgi:hypothetical protein
VGRGRNKDYRMCGQMAVHDHICMDIFDIVYIAVNSCRKVVRYSYTCTVCIGKAITNFAVCTTVTVYTCRLAIQKVEG